MGGGRKVVRPILIVNNFVNIQQNVTKFRDFSYNLLEISILLPIFDWMSAVPWQQCSSFPQKTEILLYFIFCGERYILNSPTSPPRNTTGRTFFVYICHMLQQVIT